MPALLGQFAAANDAVAGVPGKLKKQKILGQYLAQIAEDDDLRRAIRFCAGRPFAATDPRVLAVGGAIATDVLVRLLGVDRREWYEVVVQAGEIGEAIARLWPARRPKPSEPDQLLPTQPPPAEAPLTLADLSAAFDRLAATGNQSAKRSALAELFGRASTAREAAYIAKIIFSDLRTGAQEGLLQASVAQAFGASIDAIRRAQLLLGDLGEVAALARRRELASARFVLFHPVQFMLAAVRQTAEELAAVTAGRCFVAEDKLDGIRAQIHKAADGRVAIYTRTMGRADDAFADVLPAVAGLRGEFLIDGEVVPYANGQVLPFAHIQKRLGRKRIPPTVLRDNPIAFVAFDILYRDGQLLLDEPLRRRREALRDLLGISDDPPVRILLSAATPVCTAEEISRFFDAARRRRNEGVVLKDLDSPYTPGRRGLSWFKLKTHLPTIDCVVTAAEHGHGKRRGVLSDYTFAVWDRDPAEPGARLVNIGKAYSGVTDEEIMQLTVLFRRVALEHLGHCYRVPPQVVLEIAADQIQRSSRHESGYALRFPRIKRIRWDKRPEDADRLAHVAELFRSPANTSFHQSAPLAESAPEDPKDQPTLFDLPSHDEPPAWTQGR